MMPRTTRTWGTRGAIAGLLGVSITVVSCARSPAAVSPSRAAVTQAQRTDPTNGVDVLSAMHDRYAAVWYRTLSFSQTTTITLPNGGTLQQPGAAGRKLARRLRP